MVEELCPRCSKIKSLRIESEQEPRSYFFNEWCVCPKVKHDGNLDTKFDDDSHAAIEIEPDFNPFSAKGSKMVNIHGGYGDIENWNIYLDVKQALSLLEWLQQNKSTLEKIAQEG